MKLADFRRLKKLMSRTVSQNDAEALASIRAANRLLAAEELTWERVLNKTVTVRRDVEEAPITAVVWFTIAIAAGSVFFYAFASHADLLMPQLPVTALIGNGTVEFKVDNDTPYNLTVDFTLGVLQGSVFTRPWISGGPFIGSKTIGSGSIADYTYTYNPSDGIAGFWLEASNLPGDRDYQDEFGKDRDQWAAVIQGATDDSATWEELITILSGGRGGTVPMTELYPSSSNPGAHIYGAIFMADPPSDPIPEPGMFAILIGSVIGTLVMYRRRA